MSADWGGGVTPLIDGLVGHGANCLMLRLKVLGNYYQAFPFLFVNVKGDAALNQKETLHTKSNHHIMVQQM